LNTSKQTHTKKNGAQKIENKKCAKKEKKKDTQELIWYMFKGAKLSELIF